VNKEIDLSQGVHKNIITRLKGVNKESDLSPGVQKNINCLKGVNEEICPMGAKPFVIPVPRG